MGIIFLSNSGASISHDLLNALDDMGIVYLVSDKKFVSFQVSLLARETERDSYRLSWGTENLDNVALSCSPVHSGWAQQHWRKVSIYRVLRINCFLWILVDGNPAEPCSFPSAGFLHLLGFLPLWFLLPDFWFLSVCCGCCFSHSSPCHDHGDHSRWPSAPWLHLIPLHHRPHCVLSLWRGVCVAPSSADNILCIFLYLNLNVN